MNFTIPYFYTDLIARIIPGAVFLALIHITNIAPPEVFTNIIDKLGKEQFVLIPIIYAGLSYIIGSAFEPVICKPLEHTYNHEFEKMSKTYTWTCTIRTKRTNNKTVEDLTRATFGQLIIPTTDSEKQAIPHLLRFHCEAKMYLTLSIIFLFFSTFIITKYFWCKENHFFQDINHETVWLILMICLAILFYYGIFDRLRSRALFVFRIIERLASNDKTKTLIDLRKELYILSTNMKSGKTRSSSLFTKEINICKTNFKKCKECFQRKQAGSHLD